MHNELALDGVRNAWEHWLKNKDYIPHFGFKDWLKAEYGLIYSGSASLFTVRFLNEQGRVLFLLTWT